MVAADKLVITATGLTYVSRELINKRSYAPSKITMVGNVLVTNRGIASSFSASSYFTYSNLSFSESATEIRIIFDGTYRRGDENYQTCFDLVSSSNNNLVLGINNSGIRLSYGALQLFLIENSFVNEDDIRIDLRINGSEYYLNLIQNTKQKVFTGTLDETINFHQYTSLYLGTNSSNLTAYWKGFIDLTEFIIYEDSQLVYSPSTEPSFTFSHILVSDGTVTLKDSTKTIYNHVYRFPITEINRTDNSILLTATIDKDAYLTIKEVGLYVTGNEGTLLFGLISGLSINKQQNIGYDLIFNVNLNLKVVNTTVLPEIVVKKEKYATINYLRILERIHANWVIDMERAIDRNAMLLGYEPDTVFYSLFNKVKFSEENFNGAHQYARIVQHIHPEEIREYTGENLTFMGTPTLYNGDVKNFSTSDYVKLTIDGVLNDNFEIEIPFLLNKNSRFGTICCICNNSGAAKLVIGVNAAGKLFVNASGIFNKELFKVEPLRKTFLKITYDGHTYTFHKRFENETLYTKVNEYPSTIQIGSVATGYLGVMSSENIITSPFTGEIDLANLIFVSNSLDYSPSTLIESTTEIKDFYSFINYPASYFRVRNLGNLANSDITYYEGSITGLNDSVDFGNPAGFSLVLKLNLKDGKDKIILLKKNLNNDDTYLSLTFENFVLTFTLYLNDSIITLKKVYTERTFRELTNLPATLTILCDKTRPNPVYSLYINNNRVDSVEGYSRDYLAASAFKLTNYEESMSEADENYVENLLSFSGVLSEENIHYICTLLGTSF